MKKNKLKMDIEQLQKIYFEGIKEGLLAVLRFIEYERDNGNLEGDDEDELFDLNYKIVDSIFKQIEEWTEKNREKFVVRLNEKEKRKWIIILKREQI